MGLPSVLALTSLLFSLVMILLGTTLSSHGVVDRLEQKTRARYLAEAVVKMTLTRLRRTPEFGATGVDRLTVTLPGNPEGARGELLFSGAEGSLNNLAGQAAQPSPNGQVVPAHCALLIGLGTCRSAQSRVVVLVRQAEFPFVLASQGPVVSTGATRVGSTSEGSQDELLPGHLASNSALEDSVQLGPQSFVSGDLRAVGGVVLSPQATVAGQTLSYSKEVQLPQIDLLRFDPAQNGTPYQDLPVLLGDQTLAGTTRCSTHLMVQGHLQLQGASLFVNGDLRVSHGISGSGLLVVMGTTTVDQGIQLESSDRAVLLSHGAVVLHGVGSKASNFHGLVYTEGGLTAQQVSLTGAFLSCGSANPTLIDDAQMLYDPSVTSLIVSPDGSLLLPGSPGNVSFGKLDPSVLVSDLTFKGKSPAGAWTGQQAGAADTARQLFNLNDFLGEQHALEVISWREDP